MSDEREADIATLTIDYLQAEIREVALDVLTDYSPEDPPSDADIAYAQRQADAIASRWAMHRDATFADETLRVPASSEPRKITHGRHCICSACAAEDWTNPQLACCGMHGPSCPREYAPLGGAGQRVPSSEPRPENPMSIDTNLSRGLFHLLNGETAHGLTIIQHDDEPPKATPTYMLNLNVGWADHIIAERMYLSDARGIAYLLAASLNCPVGDVEEPSRA